MFLYELCFRRRTSVINYMNAGRTPSCQFIQNGVTEGQVNRLKLLKRQAYGRASVALLRQRLVQES